MNSLILKAARLFGFVVAGAPLGAAEMEFSVHGNGGNCVGCEWMQGEGEITVDTPAKLRAFVAEAERTPFMALKSRSGDMSAGVVLAQTIRDLGLRVSIGRTVPSPDPFDPSKLSDLHSEQLPGECLGACALAFMGGAERYLSEGDSFGLPAGVPVDGLAVAQDADIAAAGRLALLAMEMGVDPQVATRQGGPDGLQRLGVEDAMQLGLHTRADTQSPWRAEPCKAGLVLASTVAYGATDMRQVTLFCRDDGKWRVLITEESPWAAQSYGQGAMALPDDAATVELGGRKVAQDGFTSEYIRISGTTALASVRIEADLASHAGETLVHYPGLGRIAHNFLSVSATLPEANWLALARRNCI